MRYVICRQEGGAANMAEAYGKLTGKPGIAFVTRGPGATNASIGLHTGFQDSTPMILLVGQVARETTDRCRRVAAGAQPAAGPGRQGEQRQPRVRQAPRAGRGRQCRHRHGAADPGDVRTSNA